MLEQFQIEAEHNKATVKRQKREQERERTHPCVRFASILLAGYHLQYGFAGKDACAPHTKDGCAPFRFTFPRFPCETPRTQNCRPGVGPWNLKRIAS
jgi:hypothetical protein